MEHVWMQFENSLETLQRPRLTSKNYRVNANLVLRYIDDIINQLNLHSVGLVRIVDDRIHFLWG